jgi:hypothetical protein
MEVPKPPAEAAAAWKKRLRLRSGKLKHSINCIVPRIRLYSILEHDLVTRAYWPTQDGSSFGPQSSFSIDENLTERPLGLTRQKRRYDPARSVKVDTAYSSLCGLHQP